MTPFVFPMSPAEGIITLPAEPLWAAWGFFLVVLLSMAAILLAKHDLKQPFGGAQRTPRENVPGLRARRAATES